MPRRPLTAPLGQHTAQGLAYKYRAGPVVKDLRANCSLGLQAGNSNLAHQGDKKKQDGDKYNAPPESSEQRDLPQFVTVAYRYNKCANQDSNRA